jgi:hypothetical protein
MMLTITGSRMVLHNDSVPLADATRRPDGRWDVSTWPAPLGRDQAITALTITELLARGHRHDHPLVVTFRNELARETGPVTVLSP